MPLHVSMKTALKVIFFFLISAVQNSDTSVIIEEDSPENNNSSLSQTGKFFSSFCYFTGIFCLFLSNHCQ